MKKNSTMRVAALLLALTLMTSCFVGGTFAKYVTGDDATDSARVAKWGVEVDVTAYAFSDAYKDEAVTYTVNEDSADITVQADTKDTKVLAPGTKGVLGTVKLSGTPEVDVEVTFDVTKMDFANWVDKNGDFYCPLIITIGGSAVYGEGFTSADAFAAALTALIEDYSDYYHTNKNLATVDGANLTITWEWPFSTSEANDIKDTFLGDKAADGDTTNDPSFEFALSVTVTQVD